MNPTDTPTPTDSAAPSSPSASEQLDERQLAALLRWRRRQVRCVAAGVAGGSLFLIGLATGQHGLAWGGLGTFALALLGVFVLGGCAARVGRRG